ncbi:PAS domain-containing protein [Amaricoccus macauensis]|uniref:PAS domain-containing protein n=1 Tax=Amaricoccus macauensis TaxID=57001 RepID=UPI003C7A1D99
MNELVHDDAFLAASLAADEQELSVVITNPHVPGNPLIYVSEEFERQTGYSAEEVIGENCRFLQGPETNPDAIRMISAGLAAKTTFSVDILNYHKSGEPFMNRLRIRPLFDDEGQLLYFIGAQNPVN